MQTPAVHEAAGDFGDPEEGGGTQVAEVCVHGEFVPAANGATVDLGDEDDGEGVQRVDDCAQQAQC